MRADGFDAAAIEKRLGLDRLQRYMATSLVETFEPYVPLRAGVLKGSAVRNLVAPYKTIVYDGPYARRLYYNPGYRFNDAPMRGAFWDKRSWGDNKKRFLRNLEVVARGGRA